MMPLLLMSWMSLGKLLDFSFFFILVSYVSALVSIQQEGIVSNMYPFILGALNDKQQQLLLAD